MSTNSNTTYTTDGRRPVTHERNYNLWSQINETTPWCKMGRHFTAATQAPNTSCGKLNIWEKKKVFRKHSLHEEKSNISFNIRKNRFHLMLKYIQCVRACRTAVIYRTHVYLSTSCMHYRRLAQTQRIRFLSYKVKVISPAHKICTPFLCSTLLSRCFVGKVIMYRYVSILYR